jgi:hypothetical protein
MADMNIMVLGIDVFTVVQVLMALAATVQLADINMNLGKANVATAETGDLLEVVHTALLADMKAKI